MKVSSRVATAVALSFLFAGAAFAQTAATPAPAAPAAKTAPAKMAPAKAKPEHSAASVECSAQADAKGLHGKERKKFRSECRKGMTKTN
ncbi:MAG: phosphate starvation-inducible protein PsiF [Afipia sp.]|nr:phosphate starvation-inducible protein PsiF [Afipia sp.]